MIASLVVTLLAAGNEEIVLTDEVGKARVVMVAQAAGSKRYWAKWQQLPGEKPEGTAVFEREDSSRGARFYSVGGAAGFSLADDGKKALVKGSTVPAYSLYTRQPRPTTMILSGDAAGSADALIRAYRTEHGLPVEALSKAQVQSQLDEASKKTGAACKPAPTFSVEWSGFEKSQKAALPAVGKTFLGSLTTLCADADYREAISKLKGVRLEYASASDFSVEKRDGTLVIGVREDVANPDAQLTQWLRDNL